MKTETQIRAEIVRLQKRDRQLPHEKSNVEKLAALMMVQALAWAVGDLKAPEVRMKMK